MDKVLNFIKNEINDNSSLVVATSGGPDSMVLLDLLVSLKDKKKLNIICAHVNHNVREESAMEEDLVKKYCEDNDIIFESMVIENKIKNNFEMEARKIRYSFFRTLLEKYSAKYLLTAHHGDDLIETILMRINRGSILKGYRGILSKTNKENYIILRPLLFVTKEDILEYAKDIEIKYAIDKSNETLEHTRNIYRHKILPVLKEENKNSHMKFKEFSDELNMIDNYIEKELDKKEIEIIDENKLDCIKFNLEDKLIQIKLIERVLDKIYDGYLEVITKRHVKSIVDLINNNISNTKIDLPNNYEVIVEHNMCIIKHVINKQKDTSEYILTDCLELSTGVIKKIDDSTEKSNFVTRLSSKEVQLPLKVRYRKNGDKILIKNFSNYKKVNDIFTDEKINNSIRDEIPILLDNNDIIVWIPGIKKSNFDKDISQNYDIILKYIQKGGK